MIVNVDKSLGARWRQLLHSNFFKSADIENLGTSSLHSILKQAEGRDDSFSIELGDETASVTGTAFELSNRIIKERTKLRVTFNKFIPEDANLRKTHRYIKNPLDLPKWAVEHREKILSNKTSRETQKKERRLVIEYILNNNLSGTKSETPVNFKQLFISTIRKIYDQIIQTPRFMLCADPDNKTKESVLAPDFSTVVNCSNHTIDALQSVITDIKQHKDLYESLISNFKELYNSVTTDRSELTEFSLAVALGLSNTELFGKEFTVQDPEFFEKINRLERLYITITNKNPPKKPVANLAQAIQVMADISNYLMTPHPNSDSTSSKVVYCMYPNSIDLISVLNMKSTQNTRQKLDMKDYLKDTTFLSNMKGANCSNFIMRKLEPFWRYGFPLYTHEFKELYDSFLTEDTEPFNITSFAEGRGWLKPKRKATLISLSAYHDMLKTVEEDADARFVEYLSQPIQSNNWTNVDELDLSDCLTTCKSINDDFNFDSKCNAVCGMDRSDKCSDSVANKTRCKWNENVAKHAISKGALEKFILRPSGASDACVDELCKTVTNDDDERSKCDTKVLRKLLKKKATSISDFREKLDQTKKDQEQKDKTCASLVSENCIIDDGTYQQYHIDGCISKVEQLVKDKKKSKTDYNCITNTTMNQAFAADTTNDEKVCTLLNQMKRYNPSQQEQIENIKSDLGCASLEDSGSFVKKTSDLIALPKTWENYKRQLGKKTMYFSNEQIDGFIGNVLKSISITLGNSDDYFPNHTQFYQNVSKHPYETLYNTMAEILVSMLRSNYTKYGKQSEIYKTLYNTGLLDNLDNAISVYIIFRVFAPVLGGNRTIPTTFSLPPMGLASLLKSFNSTIVGFRDMQQALLTDTLSYTTLKDEYDSITNYQTEGKTGKTFLIDWLLLTTCYTEGSGPPVCVRAEINMKSSINGTKFIKELSDNKFLPKETLLFAITKAVLSDDTEESLGNWWKLMVSMFGPWKEPVLPDYIISILNEIMNDIIDTNKQIFQLSKICAIRYYMNYLDSRSKQFNAMNTWIKNYVTNFLCKLEIVSNTGQQEYDEWSLIHGAKADNTSTNYKEAVSGLLKLTQVEHDKYIRSYKQVKRFDAAHLLLLEATFTSNVLPRKTRLQCKGGQVYRSNMFSQVADDPFLKQTVVNQVTQKVAKKVAANAASTPGWTSWIGQKAASGITSVAGSILSGSANTATYLAGSAFNILYPTATLAAGAAVAAGGAYVATGAILGPGMEKVKKQVAKKSPWFADKMEYIGLGTSEGSVWNYLYKERADQFNDFYETNWKLKAKDQEELFAKYMTELKNINSPEALINVYYTVPELIPLTQYGYYPIHRFERTINSIGDEDYAIKEINLLTACVKLMGITIPGAIKTIESTINDTTSYEGTMNAFAAYGDALFIFELAHLNKNDISNALNFRITPTSKLLDAHYLPSPEWKVAIDLSDRYRTRYLDAAYSQAKPIHHFYMTLGALPESSKSVKKLNTLLCKSLETNKRFQSCNVK